MTTPFIGAPSADAGVRGIQRISGTGSTTARNATALAVGQMATLFVGKVALRIVFSGKNTTNAAATSLYLAPGTRYDWTVDGPSQFVCAIADDAASAFEAFVWNS